MIANEKRLPSGPTVSNRVQLLRSEKMKQIIEILKIKANIILKERKKQILQMLKNKIVSLINIKKHGEI